MKANVVSILMPIFNGEKYLRQAIESVISQSYPSWELVVVDDGSTDRTAEIVQGFNDSRIRYVYQKNQGQAAALNTCLEHAQGDYITTLDADDWMPDTSLQDRVLLLIEHPEYDAVYGNGYYCTEAGRPFQRFSDHRPANFVGDLYDILLVSPFFGTGAPVMIRRSRIELDQLRYDESIVWCQDVDFYIRLAEKAKFGYVESISVMYRLHDSNMTVQMPEGRRLDSLIKTKLKAMRSKRFQEVPAKVKRSFFHMLLVNDLYNHTGLQDEIINDKCFKDLGKDMQSSLLRQMAVAYLNEGIYPAYTRKWLKDSWKLSPIDLKTNLVLLVAFLDSKLIRFLLKIRRARVSSNKASNPFEAAKHI